jgi:hypothetical protein
VGRAACRSRFSTFFSTALSARLKTAARRNAAFALRGLFARSSNDVRHRWCAPGDVRRATGREASSSGAVSHGQCGRRGHRGTRPCFIGSGPFACRLDGFRRSPISLVARRCSTTVRRHLEARKGRRALFCSGPSRGFQRPVSTRVRSCAHRQSPVAQQRRRTSFEDVAKRPRGERFVSPRDGQERWSKGGGEKGRGTGPRAFGHQPRSSCKSDPRPPNAERAPRSTFGWGERVPSIDLFLLRPLDPPSPVARSSTPPSPRALFTPALDVRSSFKPRCV